VFQRMLYLPAAMPNSATFVRYLRDIPPSTEPLRAGRKRISREVATLGRAELLALAGDLIGAGVARFVAYELVMNHKATMQSITRTDIEKLGEGMCSWSDVDSFGCLVSGPAWRGGRIADSVVEGWARSNDWCWRRAALVSTIGSRDAKRTLKICGMLAADGHDMVVKAMSWALRALAKSDAKSVRGFLADRQGALAARVVREVNNKLSTGLKNPRKSP
jgi:3-methyladenine DNA glycosylase AlkD